MPNNSKNSINTFSPNFRDALLNRNLLADTVKNNSLSSWLDSVNKPAEIGDGIGKVKSSTNIEVDGPTFRIKNSKFNKINTLDYKNFNIPYSSVDVIFPDSSYGQYSTLPVSSPTNDGPFWRDSENIIFNLFNSGSKEYYGNNTVSYPNTNITTNTSLVDLNIQKNPETDGVFRRDLMITQNQFRSSSYNRVSLVLLPFETNPSLATLNLSPNVYAPTLETYTNNHVPPNGQFLGGNIRQFGTSKNMFLDVAKQTRTVINTTSVANQHTSYIDYNNAFLGGSKATQLINVIGSALGGGGVGFNPDSGNPVPDFDVRSSLAGRALTSAGVIDDTRLGQISPKYLASAIGNNIAFNIKEETIGRVNTSIASLIGGGKLFAANNRITVSDSGISDIIERMTGAKLPRSSMDTDIFSHNSNKYIGISNIDRANGMLKNTGSGTVNNLFKNINSNIQQGFTGNRQGYAPKFNANRNEISDYQLYALDDGDGKVKDILIQSPDNSPIPQSSYNLEGMVNTSGFKDGVKNITNWIFTRKGKTSASNIDTGFTWSDEKHNKLARDISPTFNGDEFGRTEESKKSILYKTQELFNSGNMRTLVSGKGVQANIGELDETSNTSEIGGQRYMSKGSGVLKNGGKNLGKDINPDEIFVRAWSPVDRYDEYSDLQKHSALSPEGRLDDVDVLSSVLGLNGIVKIASHKKNNTHKYMFSLENLAWDGETDKLLKCEKGPGDLLTGSKGRIMWFPPYDMVINESTSSSWDRTNFIGRGEPIYTYNNTERSGSLGWKIIVDHPNYLNFMKNMSNMDDAKIAAFFAGALDIEEIREHVMTDNERDAWELSQANQQLEFESSSADNPSVDFDIFFPNNNTNVSYTLISGYENGLDVTGAINDNVINTLNGITSLVINNSPLANIIDPSKFKIPDLKKLPTRCSDDICTTEKNYTNNSNFGRNRQAIKIGSSDEEYYVEDYLRLENSIDDFMNGGECKYCKITVFGYASTQGTSSGNVILATNRANNVKNWLSTSCKVSSDRIKAANKPQNGTSCGPKARVDSLNCKEQRKVTISIEYDSALELADTGRVTKYNSDEPNPTSMIPKSRFYTECDYFEQISDKDSSLLGDIKSKIKNFHPGFHSTTPEGFNSRLTFLQQCMRQGPTVNENTPDNLAFGKPPVCILRIGDFYHTKIIIESLTIDYEPLVWDLNPEGVGVQPMIANVNISFAFIGGSSLKGPINRLQNAVSFNYFANTELYDPRAERIKEIEKPDEFGPSGEIIPGKFPDPKNQINDIMKEPGIPGKNNKVIDAVEVSESAELVAAKQPEVEEEATKAPRITGIENIEVYTTDTTPKKSTVRINALQEGLYGKVYSDFHKAKISTQLLSDEEAEEFFNKGVKITIERNGGVLYEEIVENFSKANVKGKFKNSNNKSGENLIRGFFNLGEEIDDSHGNTPLVLHLYNDKYTVSIHYAGEKIQTVNLNIDNKGRGGYYNKGNDNSA